MPEGRQIFATLTVAENLRLADRGRLARGGRGADRGRAGRGFRSCASGSTIPAGGLSGGQQQQLAIARALLCRPHLLLLDEPSLGLAPKLVDLVFETLADLRERGVTILLVEQNAIRAAQFADRTYVLSAGKMVLTGTRDELAGHRAADLVLPRRDRRSGGPVTDLIQHVIDAISLGSLYALLALGIALIFGIMNLINFAYGELIMIGALQPLPARRAAVAVAAARLAGDRDGRGDGDGAGRVPAVPRRQRPGAAGDLVRAQLRAAEPRHGDLRVAGEGRLAAELLRRVAVYRLGQLLAR